MRALWIGASLPHPSGPGGDAHEFELLAGLAARGHAVHVLSTYAYTGGTLTEAPVRDLGVGFTQVAYRQRPWPESRWRLAAQVLRASPTLPLWLARDRIPALIRAAQALAPSERFDVVQITQGELAPVIDGLDLPSGILLFDSMTRSLATRRDLEGGVRRQARLTVELARMRRFERRWYRRASGVASVSAVDAAWCEEELARPVEVLENPVPPGFFAAPTVPREADLVSFVGSLVHHPNIDAIEWLVAEIWPLVRTAHPPARLLVAGRSDHGGAITTRLRALVEGVGGELAVDVDDIRPCYWRSGVVVAPLRQGSGLRNKVIHAMACGAPVVATPSAMEGVPPAAIAAAQVSDRAEGLADAIVRGLRGGDAVVEQARAARDAVEPLRAEAIVQRHEAWWESLCR